MRPPALIPIGQGAEDYIDEAKGLHRQGKKGWCVSSDTAALFFLGQNIKIIMIDSHYALFQQDTGTGMFFRLFPDTVPGSFPTFDTLLPAMPTFYPIYFDELVTPLYDQFKLYIAGTATPYFSATFSSPILSSHGEALAWRGALMHPQENGNWLLLRYQLTGYLNPYDVPEAAKILIYKSTVLWEYTFSALNIFPACRFSREGIAFRRLKDQETERIIACVQDDTNQTGQVYEVLEDSGGLAFSPFGLADLPNGSKNGAWIEPAATYNATGRHVDWMYDVFTSARANHYYVVKLCSDTAIAYNIAGTGYPYPNDIQFFPGMSLIVEKRLKSDLSLVATYNLTPSTVDRVCQGVAPIDQALDTVNGQTDGYATGTSIQTRFVPFGTGTVLVAADGTEYPILPALACSQDYFWNNVMGYTARPTFLNALASDPTSGYATDPADYFKRNVYQQPALLWLGTPPEGFDGWSWDGVDAAGLKITEAQSGTTNDVPLAAMRVFGSVIGDSDHVLAQLHPNAALGSGLVGVYPRDGNQRIISARVDTDHPIVRLERTQSDTQGFYMFDI